MLIQRPILRRCAVGLVAAFTASLVVATPATAGGEVDCPPGEVPGPGTNVGDRTCYPQTGGLAPALDQPAEVGSPQGSGGGTEQWCLRRDDGVDGWAGPDRVPCQDDWGWYSHLWDCHIQPAWHEEGTDETPRWDVAEGDDMELWRVRCYPPQEDADDNLMWVHTPSGGDWIGSMFVYGPVSPPGWLGTPSLIPSLWVEAINELTMIGPAIATAPPLHTAGLVRLPTWLWTEDHARSWPDEPLHARADARPDGFDSWVDVWAEPVWIEWDMGDGSDGPVCDHAGLAWEPGMESGQGLGECTHVYLRPSRHEVDGVYRIVAITTWRVWWQVNDGQDHDELEIQVGSTADYRVNEIQVLVTYR